MTSNQDGKGFWNHILGENCKTLDLFNWIKRKLKLFQGKGGTIDWTPIAWKSPSSLKKSSKKKKILTLYMHCILEVNTVNPDTKNSTQSSFFTFCLLLPWHPQFKSKIKFLNFINSSSVNDSTLVHYQKRKWTCNAKMDSLKSHRSIEILSS